MSDQSTPRESLQRVLRLRDLIFYGIVVITPIAPVPIFGVAQQLSRGHIILSLLLAGVAMTLTAFNYGRMANLYPSAGSAYVYVGRGLNPHLGFVAGWTMTMDYLVLPIVAIVQVALAMQQLFPSLPYSAWVVACALLITLLNLRGIQTTARTNVALLGIMSVVICVFLVLAINHIANMPASTQDFTQPFYDPSTFDLRAIATATSFAALTYIGFDGLTTLAEDVENPKRNVPLATVSVCLFTAIFSCLLAYVAQLIHPDYRTFPHVETAFMEVTRQVGGSALFQAMGIVVVLSSFGAALAGEVAASRVLLAMGRDDVLPRKVFARVNGKSRTPISNFLLVSAIALIGALLLNLERAGELLNFGALLGFMGVNLAAFRQCYLRQTEHKRRIFADAVVPLLGFAFCLAIWLNLPTPAKLVGGAWLLAGLIFYAARTVLSRRSGAGRAHAPSHSISTTNPAE